MSVICLEGRNDLFDNGFGIKLYLFVSKTKDDVALTFQPTLALCIHHLL